MKRYLFARSLPMLGGCVTSYDAYQRYILPNRSITLIIPIYSYPAPVYPYSPYASSSSIYVGYSSDHGRWRR